LILVLLSITVFYIHSLNLKVEEYPYFNRIIIVSYFVSFLVAMLTKNNDELHLWMIGGIIISALFDMHLGMIFTYNLVFFASFIGNISLETIVYLLIIGTLMCLLSSFMKKLMTLSYSVIIVLSIQVTLLFIMNNFMLWDTINLNAVLSLLSSLIVMGLTFCLHALYDKIIHNKKYTENKNETAATLDRAEMLDKHGTDSSDNVTQLLDENGTYTLNEVTKLDFPLLERLKEFSQKLYHQSLKVGEISAQAAIAIQADEGIARAGGYYHQIGRIVGKEYIKEGMKLAEAYHLPKVIIDMICQHNMNYDKPQTPEAAIVMLTISILSMKDYIQQLEKNSGVNQSDKISFERIVNNVFQMRLAKGSLDQSGLSIRDYNILKDFYLHMNL